MKDHIVKSFYRRAPCNALHFLILIATGTMVAVMVHRRPIETVYQPPRTAEYKLVKTIEKPPTPSPKPAVFLQQPQSLPLFDLAAPANVSGWVKKAGPAAVRSWHSSEDGPRRFAWDKFLKSRASGTISLSQSFPSVPPHGRDAWGCRLYFNRKYKLMFISTAKTDGATTVESIFPSCNLKPKVPHCLHRVPDTIMSIEEVAKIWNDSIVFTFTQNVWSRAINQYQYLVQSVQDSCQQITWNDFCGDPLILGQLCREKPTCCTKKWTHYDWYMRQQTSCFLTDQGEWAVDFIGRIEHFDDDVTALLKKVNQRRDPSVPPLVHKRKPQHNTNPLMCMDTISEAEEWPSEEEIISILKEQTLQLASHGNNNNNQKKKKKNTRRKLSGEYDEITGNQIPDVLYCDKKQYYGGKHAKCYAALTKFFANDVELLHANLTAKN